MMTVPKLTFSDSSIRNPPMKNIGARTSIRNSISVKSTTMEMSLVIRVTSEPVVKRSVCSIESAITRR